MVFQSDVRFFSERELSEKEFFSEKNSSQKFAHTLSQGPEKLFSPCVFEIQSQPFVLYRFADRFGRLWFRSTPTSCNSILNQGAWKDLESFGIFEGAVFISSLEGFEALLESLRYGSSSLKLSSPLETNGCILSPLLKLLI